MKILCMDQEGIKQKVLFFIFFKRIEICWYCIKDRLCFDLPIANVFASIAIEHKEATLSFLNVK